MSRRAGLALGLLAAGLLLAAVPAAADRGGFVIRHFDTQLTVKPDASVQVVERLEVDFAEPRHGIYRTIPVRYSDPRGFAYSLGLRGVHVTDDQGRPQKAKVADNGRYTNVRIGDPGREVTGHVVYVIRYEVRDALGHFPEHDEIYWNATGNEWNATIEHATASVRLPAPLTRAQLELAGYTGRFGAREHAVNFEVPEPGLVRFEGTGTFAPLEGLTIAVGWPHGLVTFPSPWARAGAFAVDNLVLFAPLAWLAWLVNRWRRSGRDPEPLGSVMVQYEPPPGITPGGAGTLIDESADLADVTATVVDLAIRRHLTIRAESRERLFALAHHDETVFQRESAPPGDTLAVHEQRIMDGLFASGDTVDASALANRFYAHLPGIQAALYQHLVTRGLMEESPEAVRGRFVVHGFLAGLATGVAGAAWMTLRGIPDPARVLVPVVAGVLSLVLFGVFAGAMPRRTAAGVRVRRWSLGFQEFARRVEGERLEREAADPRATFEKLLPFAMALGVASSWARRFEGIYQGSPPAWYVGTHPGGGFSTHAFERSLASSMARTGRTMTASPRSSSGSGGGGSSGGGGGGGGGGSW